MSQQLKLIKNSSFGAGMQSQFVEQVGSHDSGIWVRVKSNDARIKTSQAIIRKPISITREIAGQNDLVHPKAVPKIMLEKYRKFYKNKNRLSGGTNSSFWLKREKRPSILLDQRSYGQLFNTTSDVSLFEQEYALLHKEPLDDHIPEDQISGIEIVGTSKLKSETEWAKKIRGTKFLVSNHHVNEDGEGEPPVEEELLS